MQYVGLFGFGPNMFIRPANAQDVTVLPCETGPAEANEEASKADKQQDRDRRTTQWNTEASTTTFDMTDCIRVYRQCHIEFTRRQRDVAHADDMQADCRRQIC